MGKQYNINLRNKNIVYKAIELLYNFIGQTPSDLKITIKTEIPVTRPAAFPDSI